MSGVLKRKFRAGSHVTTKCGRTKRSGKVIYSSVIGRGTPHAHVGYTIELGKNGRRVFRTESQLRKASC